MSDAKKLEQMATRLLQNAGFNAQGQRKNAARSSQNEFERRFICVPMGGSTAWRRKTRRP